MSVTLLGINLLPKFKFVIDMYPVPLNINDIFFALCVLKLLPKSKLVIDLYPVNWNIAYMFDAPLTFSRLIFVIVSVAVHISAYPIYENKNAEFVLANISSSLPM